MPPTTEGNEVPTAKPTRTAGSQLTLLAPDSPCCSVRRTLANWCLKCETLACKMQGNGHAWQVHYHLQNWLFRLHHYQLW